MAGAWRSEIMTGLQLMVAFINLSKAVWGMVSSPTLLQSVQLAFSGQGSSRSLALALLRGAFLGGPDNTKISDANAIPDRLQPSLLDYGRAWRKLNLPRQSSGELDLVDALARHADAEAILLLGAMVRLPAPAAERAVLAPDADALLILGRAANLAWSTMRLLVAMRERLSPPLPPNDGDLPTLATIALAFDEFPRPVAERALRFIRTFAVASVPATDS